MMNNTHQLSRLTMKVFFIFLSIMLLFAQIGTASPPPFSRPGPHPGVGPHPRPGPGPRPQLGPPIPYGRVFPALPLGYAALIAAGTLFYFHAGSYYRRVPSGYIVVRTPAGAVMPALPAGCPSVVINGITYFTYGGAYYRQVANGYEVVADPSKSTGAQPLTPIGKVVVIAKALNVRSGPGVKNSVISIVHSGNILHIIGNASGWYYVQLPNGSFGWVMEKFTTPIVQPAEG